MSVLQGLVIAGEDQEVGSVDGKSSDGPYSEGGGSEGINNEDEEEYYEYGLVRDSDWGVEKSIVGLEIKFPIVRIGFLTPLPLISTAAKIQPKNTALTI